MVPLGILYPLVKKADLKEQRLRTFSSEFKEGILVLASNLSAGYSLENALTNSARELELLYGEDGMVVREFSYIVSQVRMNRPVEQLFRELGERSGLEDVQNFAEVLAVAKRSGGELVGIINHTAGILRDKQQVKEDLVTLMASRVYEQKIMNLIPYFLVFYIDRTSPGFFSIMYETVMGKAIMTVCLGVYGVSYFMSQKILKIEV